MHGSDLIQWRKSLGLGQAAASRVLSCSRASVKNWEKDPDGSVPRYIELACAAISAALSSVPTTPEASKLHYIVCYRMDNRSSARV